MTSRVTLPVPARPGAAPRTPLQLTNDRTTAREDTATDEREHRDDLGALPAERHPVQTEDHRTDCSEIEIASAHTNPPTSSEGERNVAVVGEQGGAFGQPSGVGRTVADDDKVDRAALGRMWPSVRYGDPWRFAWFRYVGRTFLMRNGLQAARVRGGSRGVVRLVGGGIRTRSTLSGEFIAC